MFIIYYKILNFLNPKHQNHISSLISNMKSYGIIVCYISNPECKYLLKVERKLFGVGAEGIRQRRLYKNNEGDKNKTSLFQNK